MLIISLVLDFYQYNQLLWTNKAILHQSCIFLLKKTCFTIVIWNHDNQNHAIFPKFYSYFTSNFDTKMGSWSNHTRIPLNIRIRHFPKYPDKPMNCSVVWKRTYAIYMYVVLPIEFSGVNQPIPFRNGVLYTSLGTSSFTRGWHVNTKTEQRHRNSII